ncbi:uncharacterized protein PRCAT00005092001 [Priceomyces carsonii]|uniref:uncharacterized protein n=1 Tax=Priceomyces carsonii TaxID=28549 RepID=UPI002ED87369|nr:unnamed protein product [Priceomyces carsonii]
MSQINSETINLEAKQISNQIPIIWNDDKDFKDHAYRRVFNLRRPERFPIAIVKIQKEEDVVNTVKLANILNVKVSVISGGHSWAAWGVRDQAIMIDFGDFKKIEFNDDTKTVIATTSVHGRMLNTYLLNEKQRFFPGGHCPDVGIGGFLLQGGMGWCCRGWGWACQKIRSLRAVTHEGKLVTCSRTENSELFWVARGCGPGFPGVVISFELETVPEKTVYSATYVYPISKFKETMNWVVQTSPKTDKDVETVLVTSIPEDSNVPVITVHIVAFKETFEDCIRELNKFESSKVSGALFESFGKKTSLVDEYEVQDRANPQGHRYKTDNVYLRSNVDVAKVLEPSFTSIPNRKTFCLYFSMDPLTKLEDMALSMQTEHYVAIYSVWDNQKDDTVISNWLTRNFRVLEKHSRGAYLGDSDFETRKTRFWAREQHSKLNNLRLKYDPERRFCGYLKDSSKEANNNDIELQEVFNEAPVL